MQISCSFDLFDAKRNLDNILEIEDYAVILCEYLPITRQYFLPFKDSYDRLDEKFMSPVNISYGINNRSAMIRIVKGVINRLEHRLGRADAMPYHILYAILY